MFRTTGFAVQKKKKKEKDSECSESGGFLRHMMNHHLPWRKKACQCIFSFIQKENCKQHINHSATRLFYTFINSLDHKETKQKHSKSGTLKYHFPFLITHTSSPRLTNSCPSLSLDFVFCFVPIVHCF